MTLICAVCVGYAHGCKQWFNQDKGYGICPKCWEFVVAREGLEQATHSYGKFGVHHNIKTETDGE